MADDPGVGGLRSTLWRFSFSIKKAGWNQLLRRGAAIWAAITNIENASETTMTTPTPLLYFLRILSMAFPLASSSTSLSRYRICCMSLSSISSTR